LRGPPIAETGAAWLCPHARLGETILIEFPECSRIHAFVRWARDGRIGLNFGHEMVLS